MASLSIVGGGVFPGTASSDHKFKGKLFNFQYFAGSLAPPVFPTALQQGTRELPAIGQVIMDYYLIFPGKLIAYETNNWQGPKFMLSGKDHYTSTFADVHTDDLPINLGRYHGIKGFLNMNTGELEAMNSHQVTYSLRAKVELLPFFQSSAASCSYVTSLTGSCTNQWLYNFWYEPIIGFSGVQLGTRLTPTCTCVVGTSLTCVFNLEVMSSATTVAAFETFTLGTDC